VITVAPCSLQTRVIHLIILGKHGLGLGIGVVEEFILGSNTRQILTHVRCDVLIANR
jgi:nucleotide-binding universal stress UspA family protein